jgi:hypothetical protein
MLSVEAPFRISSRSSTRVQIDILGYLAVDFRIISCRMISFLFPAGRSQIIGIEALNVKAEDDFQMLALRLQI